MPTATPSEGEIEAQTRRIIVKAYETDTVDQLTKRLVREQLQGHFGVDLEQHKKFISNTIQLQVNEVGEAQKAKASEASSSKKAKPEKAKPTNKTAPPPKKPDASCSGPHQDGKLSADIDEEDFSELEDEVSKKPARASKSAKPAAKPRTSNGSSAAGSRSSTPKTKAGQSEAEQRLTRLKSLVVACGVRKPWKKLYDQASVGADDFNGQCRIVQNVLNELGMTGRGSLEQAKKIRDEREFADELAALQENKVESSSGRGGRRARTGNNSKRSTVEMSDDSANDDASEFGDSSDEEPQAKKRKATRKATSSHSDSEDEDAPPKRKTFKSSLASFAAGLNSDSD